MPSPPTLPQSPFPNLDAQTESLRQELHQLKVQGSRAAFPRGDAPPITTDVSDPPSAPLLPPDRMDSPSVGSLSPSPANHPVDQTDFLSSMDSVVDDLLERIPKYHPTWQPVRESIKLAHAYHTAVQRKMDHSWHLSREGFASQQLHLLHASIRGDHIRALQEITDILALQNLLDQAKGHIDDCLDSFRKEGIRTSMN
jgi:hypothetical protein